RYGGVCPMGAEVRLRSRLSLTEIVPIALALSVLLVPAFPSAQSTTLTVTPAVVFSGDTVTVAIDNGPGGARDWLGLFAAGASDATYLDWKYLNGTRSAPATG